MADVIVPLGGWGSQGWGESAWGFGSVSLVATGSVGSVIVVENISVSVTGVNGTGNVGQVTVQEGIGVSVTGVVAQDQLVAFLY